MNENRAILIVFAVILLGIGFTVVWPMFQSPGTSTLPNGILSELPTEIAATGKTVPANSLKPRPTAPAVFSSSAFPETEDLEPAVVDGGPNPVLPPFLDSGRAAPGDVTESSEWAVPINNVHLPENEDKASELPVEYADLRPVEIAHLQRVAAIDQTIAAEEQRIEDLTAKLKDKDLDKDTRRQIQRDLSKAQSNLRKAQSNRKTEVANAPPPLPLDAFRDVMNNPKWRDSGTLARAARALSANEFPEAMQQVDSLGWTAEGHKAMNTLMDEWGRRDITSAIAHAESYDNLRQRKDAMSRAINGWVSENPEQAFRRLVTGDPEDPFNKRINVGSVFEKLAKDNPDQTLQRVWDLPEASDQSRALGAALGAFEKQERESIVRDWFQQTPDTDTQKMLARRLVDNWRTYEPETAAQFVDSIPSPEVRETATSALVGSWGSDDPPRAMDWLWSQSADKQNAKHISRVVGRWYNDEPNAAADYLNGFPPTERLDPAVGTLARSMAKTNPAGALDWANSILNEKTRQSTSTTVYNTWIKDDPRGAYDHILQSPQFTDEARHKLLTKATQAFNRQQAAALGTQL